MTGTPQLRRWHLYPAVEELAQSAAGAISRCAEEAIKRRSAFHIVLAGGNTPRYIYEHLAQMKNRWSGWHIYFGDERCLPADHADRNSVMACQAWLDQVPIPKAQIHVMPTELGPEAAAEHYARVLNSVQHVDMALLGLGADGHTAGLMPGHNWGVDEDAPPVLPITDAPPPYVERVTMSARYLSRSRQVFFFVTGANKAEAINRWRHNDHIPVCAITPNGHVDIWVDETAWP